MENGSPHSTLPISALTQFRYQQQPPTTDQTHIPESLNSPSYGDKYTTIHSILQMGVAALETLDNPNLEETPKDIISLIKFISHKLITIEHKQDMKTFEHHLDHLSQKIESLTKALIPPDQNYKVIVPQPRKSPSHTTHTTSKKQPNPQNPLAHHHPSRLTIIFHSPPL
jgi:hypothetical protein